MSKIILCADDSKTMRTVAEITFRASEYSYVGAQSADEALQKAHANKPALILADAVMPGKTGYDLCKAVKTDPALADVPVVLLCGNSSPYDAEKGGDVGADGHVTKPWDTQVMLDKMDEILKKAGTAGIARPAGAAATPPVVPKPPILPATMGAGKARPEPASTTARTTTMMGMPMPSVPLPSKSNRPATAGGPPASVSPPAASASPLAQPAGQSIDMDNAKPLGAPLTSRQPGARPVMARPATQPGGPGAGAPAPAPAAAPMGARAPARLGVPATGRAASRAGGVPAATPVPSLGAPTSIPDVPLPAPVAPAPRAPATRVSAAPAASAALDESAGVRRPPMIRGVPRRGDAPAPRPTAGAAGARADVAARIERAVPAAAASVAQQAGIDPGGPEMKALMALSKDVIERIVWEVVPDLAEAIIRENLDRLAKR